MTHLPEFEFIVTLVAVPIGHPQDLSPRAKETIQDSQVVFCEDSRKLRTLAEKTNIDLGDKKIIPLPGDQESTFDFDSCFLSLKKKNLFRICFVSDAGSPVISDPGQGLLRYSRQKNFQVKAVPGPSAWVLALQWSGAFGLPFCFGGFAPKAKSSQSQELQFFFDLAKQNSRGTFCFFDTKHQYSKTLGFLAQDEILSHQKLYVCREMTKPHEDIFMASPAEVLKYLQEKEKALDGALGEMSFVLDLGQSAQKKKLTSEPLENSEVLNLCHIIRKGSPKEAAKAMSRLSGVAVSDCYKKIIS